MTKGHLAYKCRRTCSVNFEHGAELNANIFVKTVLYFYIVLPSNKKCNVSGLITGESLNNWREWKHTTETIPEIV